MSKTQPLKFRPLYGVLGLTSLIWIGVEFYWLPHLHHKLEATINQKYQVSKHLATQHLTPQKYPLLFESIEKNSLKSSDSVPQIQIDFSLFITELSQKFKVNLHRLDYLESTTSNYFQHTVFALEISGSLNSIQNFLLNLEKDIRLINVTSLNMLVKEKTSLLSIPENHDYNLKMNIHLNKISVDGTTI